VISRISSSIWSLGVSLFTPRPQPALENVSLPARREKGQALIELVLVLPLIFVFILVIVDFGLALDRREVIQHDVREGARRGAVGASVAQIEQAAGEVPGTFEIDVCYVDKNGNGNPGNAGDSVRVSGTYVYEFTVGSGELLSVFGVNANGWDITMTPSAESRLETSVAGANAC
jgi:Flp pilus assembly protein TadG